MTTRTFRARIAAATAAVLVGSALLAAPAAADDPSVSFNVLRGSTQFVDPETQNLPAATVNVYAADDTETIVGSFQTGSDASTLGSTSINIDLPAGQYRFEATMDGYLPGWYTGDTASGELALAHLYGWAPTSTDITSTIVTVVDEAPTLQLYTMLFTSTSTVGGIAASWFNEANMTWDVSNMWPEGTVIFAELIDAVTGDVAATTLASRGAYSFEDAPVGTFRIRATIGTAGESVPTGPDDLVDAEEWWYPGTQDEAAAQTITVAPGGGHWVGANIATDDEYFGADEAVITGDLYEGGLVTVAMRAGDESVSAFGPSLVESYEWALDGESVPGASGASFVLPPGSAGKTVAAAIKTNFLPAGMRFAYAGGASSTVAAATGAAFVAPLPSIGGQPILGRTLSAQPGTWTPAGTKTYQWYRDGEPISGATDRQYIITEEDLGTALTVTVTGQRSGYMTAHRTSAPVSIELAAFTNAPVPTVRGAARIGTELSVGGGTWRPQPVDVGIQWNRDGEPIPDAVDPSYVLGPDDLGAVISVTATGSKPGYLTQTLTSAPTAPVGLGRIVAPKPPILGPAQVGQTLSIDTSSWNPTELSVAYRWQRDGFGATGAGFRDIVGATGATYTLTAADVGRQIRLIVDVTAEWYEPVRRATDPVGPVVP